MTEQRIAAPPLDVVGLLMRQNYYQRLGLKTNAVQPAAITEAFNQRLRILNQCQHELSSEVSAKALHLIEEANVVLSDPPRRLEYDRYLENLQRWRGTPPVNQARGTEVQPSLIRGRYSLGNILHEGKRARIFDAEDTSLNRPVVVKQVRGEFLRIADYQRMFRDEAERFARFTSGNLVKVLDYDPALGALVMEKMTSDLRGALVKKGCSHAFAMDILRDALGGLCELHAEGLVHGRIDLSHIMLDDHGSAKLAVTPGFGAGQRALLPGHESSHLAPEMLNPEVFGEVKYAADIYSLGFVVLELLVGKSFAQRISASVAQSDNSQSAWLQWHASPTDHLPAIESMVPGLPTSFCSLLKRMTCKQQHERYASASECLQNLKLLQATSEIETEAFPINPETTETGSIQILGSPDPIHGRYEAPPEVGWLEIAKNPALLMQPEAKRQRLFVISMAAVAAVLLLLLSSGPRQNPGNSIFANTIEEPSYESDVSLAINGQAEAQLMPNLEAEPTILEAETPSESLETRCLVTFRVVPAGEVSSVKGLGKIQELDRNLWQLPSGSYTVCYAIYGDNHDHDALIEVPEDSGQMTVVLQTKTIKESLPTEVPVPDAQLADESNRIPTHKRSRSAFKLVGFEKNRVLESEYVSKNLANYFRNLSLGHPCEITNLNERAKSQRRRDPRISFAYALQAHRDGDNTLARDQCYRALHEAEEFGVPFVLPLELLCHIELQRSGKGLQHSLAACRDTFHWVRDYQQQNPGKSEFQGVLEDVVWWTGLVTAYIEQTRDESVRAHVNVENTRVEIEAQLEPELQKLFGLATRAVSLKHQKLLAEHQQRAEILAEREAAEDERAERAAEEKRQEESSWMFPQVYSLPGASTNNPSILSSVTLASSGLQSQPYASYGQPVFVPTGSHRDNNRTVFVGPRVSPYQFTHYEACDRLMFAEFTRLTIPLSESPNKP